MKLFAITIVLAAGTLSATAAGPQITTKDKYVHYSTPAQIAWGRAPACKGALLHVWRGGEQGEDGDGTRVLPRLLADPCPPACPAAPAPSST